MVDQNSLFNKNTRILALDDAPFDREDTFTEIIGLIIRRDLYVESIVKKTIQVDGLDVTDKILEIIREKGDGIRVIMMKGITFGGFNILDVERLYQETKIPIINYMDHPPDIKAIENALRKHFKDWEERFSLFNKYEIKENGAYISCVGLDPLKASRFLNKLTRNGKIPEPLRMVNLIASIC